MVCIHCRSQLGVPASVAVDPLLESPSPHIFPQHMLHTRTTHARTSQHAMLMAADTLSCCCRSLG